MLLRDSTFEFDARAGRMRRRSMFGMARDRALAEICGVQVLRGLGGRFDWYQLNLVLSGGGRENLISDSDLRSIREAGVALGELLGVAVDDRV
jgi:hypothetical protein